MVSTTLTSGPALAGGDGSEASLFLLLLLILASLLVPPLMVSLLVWVILVVRKKAQTAARPQSNFNSTIIWVCMSFAVSLLLWGGALYVHHQKKKIDEKQAQIQFETSQTIQRQQQELQWKMSPLGIAACRADLNALKDVVNSEPQNLDVEAKLTIAKKCAIETGQADVLRILIADPTYRDPEKSKAWFEISQAVFDSFNLDLASVILAVEHSEFKTQQHQLWLAALIKNQTITASQKIAWLKHLQKNGVAIEAIGPHGLSLLRVAFETQDASVINFALDLGMDPYARSTHSTVVILHNEQSKDRDNRREKTEVYTWSPLQSWTLRRFGYIWPEQRNQGLRPAELSEPAIRSIQKRLRELNAEEAGLRYPTYQLRTDMPDGGAALFTYMLSRGVPLNIADAAGKGLLSAHIAYSDQLLQALDQLPDEQLQKLNCPRGIDGFPPSLVEQARQAHHQGLLKLFARHQLKRCAFAH